MRDNINKSSVVFILPSVALAMLIQPWWQVQGIWLYDFSRWVEIGFLIAFAWVCCITGQAALIGVERFYKFCFFIFLLLTFLSCLASSVGWISWSLGFRGVLWFFTIIVLSYNVSGLPKSRSRAFSLILILSIFFHLLYSFFGVVVLALNGVVNSHYMVSAFSNKNHAVSFYVPCLLILPALEKMLDYKMGGVGFAFMLIGALLSFMIFAIGARGGIFALVLSVLIVLWVMGSQSRRYVAWIVKCLAAGVVLFLLLDFVGELQSNDEILFHKNVFSDSQRLLLWSRAWDGIVTGSLFGGGPLSYSSNRDLSVAHAHSLVLSLIYEYGFAFFVFICAFSIIIIRKLWLCRRAISSDLMAMSGFAAMMAFSIHAQVSGATMVPASMLIVAIAIAFCFSPILRLDVSSEASLHRWKYLYVFLIACVSILYILVVSAYWARAPITDQLEPRFWQHGEV
tara:strand:- start:1208 stop:2569 length:1362 start_codon:yes stop_codon:yes gene_type:complete